MGFFGFAVLLVFVVGVVGAAGEGGEAGCEASGDLEMRVGELSEFFSGEQEKRGTRGVWNETKRVGYGHGR